MKTKMIFLVLFIWILSACADDKDYLKLGWEYLNKKEFQKAFETFDKACKEENFQACFNLWGAYKLGIRIKQDEQKAKEYYQKTIDYANKTCEKNNAKACSYLGNLYLYGTTQNFGNIQKDENKGLELLQKACELGNYKSCYTLGKIYQGSFASFAIKEDEQKSKEYYQKGFEFANKACEKNEAGACIVLTEGYEYGIGTTKDKAKADIFYKKAFELVQKECLAGGFYHSCYSLGLSYLDGKPVPKDTQKAKEYLQKACDVDNASACNMLGTLYEAEQDTQKTKEYFQKACKLGVIFACKK